MAVLIANKDGTSNAKAGDIVITGGGIFKKKADGTSEFINPLPTSTGKTSDYNVLTGIYNQMSGKGSSAAAPATPVVTQPVTNPIDQVLGDTTVFDSYTNYDSFTTPGTGSSALYSGQKINFSNIMGYVIVGLVLLVVLDKLIGGGK